MLTFVLIPSSVRWASMTREPLCPSSSSEPIFTSAKPVAICRSASVRSASCFTTVAGILTSTPETSCPILGAITSWSLPFLTSSFTSRFPSVAVMVLVAVSFFITVEGSAVVTVSPFSLCSVSVGIGGV